MKSDEFLRIIEELRAGRIARLSVTAGEESFTRVFMPMDRLILLGCGHVSHALYEFAVRLDFSVTAVDDRPDFANRERFPEADRVICSDFPSAVRELNICPGDFVCVLTRGHRWDCECIRAILSGEAMPTYLGMIGSHRRADGLRELLRDEGFDEERIAQLHAPIGLKIGAVTPHEIAVSICAQMITHRRNESVKLDGNAMAQMNSDYAMLEYLAYSDEPRAMLLVLDAGGSTPVKSGAMMAVNRLGKGYGTIGGGCGEAAAKAQARKLIGTGGSKIIELDMSSEVAEENGMVCGGSMRVLIEDITK